MCCLNSIHQHIVEDQILALKILFRNVFKLQLIQMIARYVARLRVCFVDNPLGIPLGFSILIICFYARIIVVSGLAGIWS